MRRPNTKLKMALLEKGLTQRDLSFEIGISESVISTILNGYRQPGTDLKAKIAEYLGAKSDSLFLEELEQKGDEETVNLCG